MKITWQADDGYVTGSRPHVCNINDDDLDECETKEQWEELISDYVEEDFKNKVCVKYQMPPFPGKKQSDEDNED